MVINDYPTYLFVLPPDTINLLNKREFIDVLYSFGRIFSSITVVDYQNIKVATGVDSYSWIKHNNSAADSSVHIIPITSIYNVKNKNQITIPGGTFHIKMPKIKGTAHYVYEPFTIYLLETNSILYKIKGSVGFTSDDQSVILSNIFEARLTHSF